MILSDLKQEEKAVITKVNGNGAFRKRIIEMGFVVGQPIEVIKKAPLRGPVEYKVMGYNISLRNREADLIEVLPHNEYIQVVSKEAFSGGQIKQEFANNKEDKERVINIALVGNPNCGKTTIFNYASKSKERVANYAGATVEAKEAKLNFDGYVFNLIDLPGTYSITSYTPEEQFVREQILTKQPDIVLNVIDSSNLERNLFLTTQLIDMHIKVVSVLNMYDELEAGGDQFDHKKLELLLGVPFVPAVGTKGTGINDIFKTIVDIYEGKKKLRHIHPNYGSSIEKSIMNVREIVVPHINKLDEIDSARFLSIKLLEKDKWANSLVGRLKEQNEIAEVVSQEIKRLETDFKDDSESVLSDAKYGFIAGALKETFIPGKKSKHDTTKLIDAVLIHKLWGIPIFFFLMWLTFYSTFKLGAIPMQWMEYLVHGLSSGIDGLLNDGFIKDFLVDGIIGGVGGVIVFLPNIFILFFFISLMEDTGYLARTAFIMDKAMHIVGLHGKSFIPLLMGFGCNVPAIMATRTIENRKDRLVTMLIIPFMSCSARLPVYVLFISAFFPDNQGSVLFLLYLIGILVSMITAILLNKTVFKKEEMPFVMELPPYRMPTSKALVKHVWFKGSHYIKKMGGVILVASIIIWALGYFPREVTFTRDYDSVMNDVRAEYTNLIESSKSNTQIVESLKVEQADLLESLAVQKEGERQEKSLIGRAGKFIEPVFRPLGFDWKMSVSILTGMGAKEIIVSSMGVLYQADRGADETSGALINKMQAQTYKSGTRKGNKVFSPLVAFSFMLFILLYFPCIATLTALKKESGSWIWMGFTVLYTTGVAWIIAFAVYQIGSIFVGQG